MQTEEGESFFRGMTEEADSLHSPNLGGERLSYLSRFVIFSWWYLSFSLIMMRVTINHDKSKSCATPAICDWRVTAWDMRMQHTNKCVVEIRRFFRRDLAELRLLVARREISWWGHRKIYIPSNSFLYPRSDKNPERSMPRKKPPKPVKWRPHNCFYQKKTDLVGFILSCMGFFRLFSSDFQPEIW